MLRPYDLSSLFISGKNKIVLAVIIVACPGLNKPSILP
jgi:hypothetical protein